LPPVIRASVFLQVAELRAESEALISQIGAANEELKRVRATEDHALVSSRLDESAEPRAMADVPSETELYEEVIMVKEKGLEDEAIPCNDAPASQETTEDHKLAVASPIHQASGTCNIATE
jgi:hypothetical protein